MSLPSVAPFQILPELQAIAIAYSNNKLIADLVLPRIRPVGKQAFAWMQFALQDGFYIPDTKVGRKSQPNQVEFSATLQNAQTQDYFLEDPIPWSDIENAPENFDPRTHSTEMIMYLIQLDRERRVSNLVFNANTYPASNQVTLSGTSQFSDYVNSDPVTAIKAAMDAMVMRPNKMVIGRPAWSVLQSHPDILKAVYRNLGDAGNATAQEVAEVLELDQIIVGEAWMDSSKQGQNPTLARLWGKNLALIYQGELFTNTSGVTFGYTVPWGVPMAGGWEDKNIGPRGGVVVRAGESVEEVIAAPLCGYLMQNVVA
jgi:hypothetical protein